MQYQILIKQQGNESFLAIPLGIPQLKVEGKTKEQAIDEAKKLIEVLLKQGEIVTIEIESKTSNPWLELHGKLKDEPAFEEFLAEISTYREFLDKEIKILDEKCVYKETI